MWPGKTVLEVSGCHNLIFCGVFEKVMRQLLKDEVNKRRRSIASHICVLTKNVKPF